MCFALGSGWVRFIFGLIQFFSSKNRALTYTRLLSKTRGIQSPQFWLVGSWVKFIPALASLLCLVLKDGFCAAVEGVVGGVVLVDVDDGYSQEVYYQLIR